METERERFIKAHAALNPVPTDAEITLVTTALDINEVTQTLFDDARTEGDQPDKGDADGKNNARDAVNIIKMGGFQVKAVAFHVAVHFFRPHADPIVRNVLPFVRRWRLIGDEEPRFVLTGCPMQREPEGTRIMFFGQMYPTDDTRLAFSNGDVTELDPRLTRPANLILAGVTEYKMPLLLFQPGDQINRFKTSIAQEYHARIRW